MPPPTQNINGFQLAMYLTKKITPPPPPSPIPHIKNPDIIFFCMTISENEEATAIYHLQYVISVLCNMYVEVVR